MKILLAGAALLALTSGVQAQEPTWDGWFAGFDAGYINRTITGPNGGDVNYGGPTVGLIAGHWWQVDPVTLGFDGGISLGGAHRSTTVVTPPPFPATITGSLAEVVTVSARAKVGAPVGDLLVYAAAGVQYVHQFQQSSISSPTLNQSDSGWFTESGFVASLGAEYKVAPSFSVRGEVGLNGFWPRSGNDRFSGYHAKAGLNYYFE